jgi:hypothetical protein
MNGFLKWTLVLALIFAAFFAVGCAKTAMEDSDEGSSTGRMKLIQAEPMVYPSMPAADLDYAAETIAVPPMYREEYYDGGHYGSGEGINIETKIIRNAYMSIEVEDFFLASQKAEAYAKKYGGYVSNSDASADMNSKHSGTMTIRVPELHFDAAMAELTLLGEVKSKNTNGNDVTEEYIDLESRISSSKAHEERLVAMYKNATNVKEMMNIENELSRVRSEIESMQGRLRYMDNRVEMSTITVHIYEETPAVKEWGIWQSFKKALNNSLATLRWMIELIGWLLPLAAFGAAIFLMIRWIVRRGRTDIRRR